MATDEEDHPRAGAADRGRVGLVYRIDYIAGLAGALGYHLLLQFLRVHLPLKLGLADIRAELGWRDERMGRSAAAQQQCAGRHPPPAHGHPSRARQQPDPWPLPALPSAPARRPPAPAALTHA